MTREVSRRNFLKGVGAGVGAIGLSRLSQMLVGCSPVPDLFYGQELIGKVTGNKATIRLVAGETCETSTKFRLFYDTVPRSIVSNYRYQTSEVSGFQAHDPINFQLNALSSNQRYYYRVGFDPGSGWEYRDEYNFHTKRPAGQPFRFCIATDTHVYPYNTAPVSPLCSKVYRNVLADAPDLLLTLGDDPFVAFQTERIYTWPEQETLWSTFERARSIIDNACHSMSFLPVNGNHEGLFGWTIERQEYQDILEAKMRYFAVPDSGTFPEGGDDLGRYGAFTWGDVLFVWLDVMGFCEVDPFLEKDNAYYVLGTDQRNFLESTLANSSAAWKFVFAHHLFGGVDSCEIGYGRGNGNAAGLHDQAEVQALMEEYGAQAFFYGHDHIFSVNHANNCAYICAGQAGSKTPKTMDFFENCYSPYEILSVQDGKGPAGHVRIDVSPTQVVISYVKASLDAENGSLIDTYIMNL